MSQEAKEGEPTAAEIAAMAAATGVEEEGLQPSAADVAAMAAAVEAQEAAIPPPPPPAAPAEMVPLEEALAAGVAAEEKQAEGDVAAVKIDLAPLEAQAAVQEAAAAAVANAKKGTSSAVFVAAQEQAAAEAAPAEEPEEEPEFVDPLSIGNEIGVFTEKYGYIVGTIIYRSNDLVRVMSQEYSDRAYDFPLINDGESFSPDLGITGDIDVLKVNPFTYYVDFLGVRPGEILEFFTADGTEARPPAEVTEVIKSRTKDSVKLADGTILKFAGRGPPPPIAVIRVRTAINAAAAAPAEAPAVTADEIARAERQAALIALLRAAQGPAAVEVIPTAERTYPDAVQREEQFNDLLGRLSSKQKVNPRRIRAIEREVDLSVALKNQAIQRDEVGRPIGTAPAVFDTLSSVIEAAPTPLAAAIPIVNAAQTLYLDNTDEPMGYKKSDVAPQSLPNTIRESDEIANMYLDGSLPASLTQSFIGYTYDLLTRGSSTLQGATPMAWPMDQDVIRTAGLELPVQGLSVPEDADPVTLAYLVSNTTDRYMRVLHPDTMAFHRAFEPGPQLAPSDPSEVSGYVMLPIKAALALRPPQQPGDLPTALLYSTFHEDANLPTVAQALRDLYTQRDEATPLNASTVTMDEARELQIAEWLDSALKYAVHPVDSLGPRGPRLLALLDAMGLSSRDLSPAVTQVVNLWVRNSQRLWQRLLKEERARIKAVLEAETDRTFQTVTGDESPAWAAIRSDELLQDLLADVQLRNPAIFGSETMLTASLLREAQGDAVPLVWDTLAKVDGRDLPVDPMLAAASLAASRSYTLRRRALRDFKILTLRAEPEINTCIHVNRLEAIRNLSDTLQRARLLREFIDEFQGGRSGDWITCALCQKECVCFHEVMELEALAQPARMETIKKQILIRYGGERYEGKIVCRNCGQALQEIDYDEHVEFDDDGRPITGRSVLADEQIEEAENNWLGGSKDLAAAELLHFKTEDEKEIYRIVQEVLDHGRLVASPEVVRAIVDMARKYERGRLDDKEVYNKKRLAAMSRAAAKAPPAYETLVSFTRFAAIGALISLMIQIADPPITSMNPYPLCRFGRGGYPLDPDAALPKEFPGGGGGTAVEYVVCVMSSMDRNTAPWNVLPWNVGPKRTEVMESRRKQSWPSITGALALIVQGDPQKAQLPFIAKVQDSIATARTDVEGMRARSLLSLKDQLRVGFRPEPFPPKARRPAVEKDPVPAIADALATGASVAPMMGPVSAAMREQALAVIGELHAAAAADVEARAIKPASVTDDVCCPTTLTDADAGASLLGAPEAGRLVLANDLVRGGIPTATNAGTHLWASFVTPIPPPVEQAVEEGVLFKLFLKYCYTGGAVGEPHEFSVGNSCRQCGLVLGKPLDLIDFGVEGAGILAAQQGDLKVEVTPAAFNALSDAVRRRRRIASPVVHAREPWYRALEELVVTARAREDLPAGEGVFAFANALDAVITALAGRESEVMDEETRLTAWVPLNEYMDQLRAEVEAAVGPVDALGGSAAAKARAQQARMAMEMFDIMTSDPFIEGPRAVQEYWCGKAQAAGQDYAVKTVNGARWFKLSPKHDELLNKLMEGNANWYNGTITDGMKPILRRLGKASGPLLRVWIRSVRPSTQAGGPWTQDEAQMVLRCIVLQSWRDAVMPTSWMYAGIGSAPAAKEVIARGVADWTRALLHHVRQQFMRYSKDRIKQILQQRAELERTSVVQEFKDLNDDDLRASYIMMKQFKIGRWARGANIQKLDADQFDFEQKQLEKMGIQPNMAGALQMGGFQGALEAPVVEQGSAYDVNQLAAGDDY